MKDDIAGAHSNTPHKTAESTGRDDRVTKRDAPDASENRPRATADENAGGCTRPPLRCDGGSETDSDNGDDPAEGFDYGQKLSDGQFENYPTIDEGEFEQGVRETYVHADGCGEATTMTGDLPESVARDPEYYSRTFCAGCGEHVPVEEVQWDDGCDWVVDVDRMADTDAEHRNGGDSA